MATTRSVIVGSRRCTSSSPGNCNYGTLFDSGDGGLNLYSSAGFTGLSMPSGWNPSEVRALDGDGSVVVIAASSASDSRVSATVIWNRSSVGALMPTPLGFSGAAAFDVDAAGDTFVGTRLGTPSQAILFELPSTFTLVSDALEARGVELPAGVVLNSANEVSNDGTSIVGLGKTQSGANMVWRAELN